MQDILFNNFKRHFPLVAEKAEEYREESVDELFVRLKNGDCVIYDDVFCVLRTLPSDSNCLTEEECRKEFGRRLQRLMRNRGVTQTELAEMVGTSQARISNYISGRVTPSFYMVDKIAKALGCSIEKLRYVG